jgi:nitroimidazol reductase NimA-like FMN-containing flavoprotein (pyridoxamine 5'-phosphate oxidase superfamily)
VIDAILDEGYLCHVAFSDDDTPYAVPMAYARSGDVVYLHGASGNRTLRALAAGAPACVTVTLLDGLVLARSAFHHSMNYRSVMLFGSASRIEGGAEELAAAAALLDQMAPGRSADARPPTAAERRATLMLRFPIEEGAAKVRTGGPIDEPEDLALAVWAGVVPLALTAGAPVPEADLAGGVATPAYLGGPGRRR